MIKFRLDKILKEQNMSVSTLSKLTGISRPSLSAMSNNTSRSVNLDFLENIMSTLNVGLTDIIYEEENKITIRYNLKNKKPWYVFSLIATNSKEEVIFENEVGFITQKEYNETTKEYYKSFTSLEKKEVPWGQLQSYNFVVNPVKYSTEEALSTTSYKNEFMELLNFINILGKENMYKLLTALINDSLVNEELDFEELLIIPTAFLGMFYFTFDNNKVVPVNNQNQNDKNYPKIELIKQ
ncbi:MAG: helix-turn-helix transcriptional regulator [Vagococcus sp.]|uniref:helix-turn-helix domain-containing protein n=1 Tax=Vagococcus sp. TaxID=1933889 RepID=UPI002FCB4F45